MVRGPRAAAVAVLLLSGTVLGGTVLGGGTAPPQPVTTGVVYCTSPLGAAADAEETVEYRQGEEVVASTVLPVGSTYRAEVPTDRRTDVYVDGRLVGSAGEDDPGGSPAVTGGHVALLGEGCPDVATGSPGRGSALRRTR